tara:strand:+ start:2621 stop:3574 length:954 start_codon:yes stop_codon:yes gene_type:complete
MISAGVIGYRNHSKKIIDIARKNSKIKFIYHPYKKIRLKNFTNNLEDLLKVDCVFILSPNNSHYKYLHYFNKKKYNGYIFCEKPPVLKINEVKKLKSFKLKNTYFNFNYRHSPVLKFLKHNKQLGRLINISIIDSKPLIYKNGFKKNWRFDTKEILINNNLIHFVDLVGFCFKEKISDLTLLSSKSKPDIKIFDTVQVSFKINKILANISVSYGSILEKKILFYYSNGKVEICNNRLKIYYPGRLKNKNGNYIEPKLLKTQKINDLSKYSLRKSVEYFLKKVKLKQKFLNHETSKSIISNILCIKLTNSLKNRSLNP